MICQVDDDGGQDRQRDTSHLEVKNCELRDREELIEESERLFESLPVSQEQSRMMTDWHRGRHFCFYIHLGFRIVYLNFFYHQSQEDLQLR